MKRHRVENHRSNDKENVKHKKGNGFVMVPSCLMSQMTMSTPNFESLNAISLPRPPPPPVTRASSPCNFCSGKPNTL